MTVETYYYVAVCTLQARRREALRRPQREEGQGHIVAAARLQLVYYVKTACYNSDFFMLFVFRSTSKSRPNNIGGKMSVRPSVHKKFLRFE